MNFSDLLKRSYNIKIFSLNRIKYEELYDDAIAQVKKVYNDVGEKFSAASPFAQLLGVVLHLGRMILYYIEDAITGLNIRTAWRPDQIRGLAVLTGHDPSRAISSRAAINLVYNGKSDHEGEMLYIPNKIQVNNSFNGLDYVIMFGADVAKMTMAPGNYIKANIVQGLLKYQTATSDGMELQSYNFSERNYAAIEQFFINIYVNGERWDIVKSLPDMGYEEHACVVRTGQVGGLDIFFGNGQMGAIPPAGASIICEYISTAGQNGNFAKNLGNTGTYWNFSDYGYLADGTTVDLNEIININMLTDCIFGSSYENIALTQQIAPYTSRSMVLANATNYKYFLKKLNMFSIIDVIQGFNTYDDTQAEALYQQAASTYASVKAQYDSIINAYGPDSDMGTQVLGDLKKASNKLKYAKRILRNAKADDNTVYLFLIPDIKNRITSSSNYFNCDENVAFNLTDDEKYNIINLIDMSGESIISVENKILQPLFPRFSINVNIRIWEGYDYSDLYNTILEKISDYLIDCKRRDRIPVSDLIALVEGISGIDSVSIYFDADPNNKHIYGNDFNGIDEYGDVVLSRTITNQLGNTVTVNDIYPLFRGGFTNNDGVEYSDEQSIEQLSALNVSIIGKSNSKVNTNIENKLIKK